MADGDQIPRMARIRKTNTKPELRVRKLLHGMGYRFRLHRRDLPGTPDIVLPRYHAVIYVHGCFWHQHESCRLARMPKRNLEYWAPKLARNRARDEAARLALEKSGWRVHIVWECETFEEAHLSDRLAEFLDVKPTSKSE